MKSLSILLLLLPTIAALNLKRISKEHLTDRSGVHFDIDGNVVRVDEGSIGGASGIGLGMKILETNGMSLSGKDIAEYIAKHVEIELATSEHCHAYGSFEFECVSHGDCAWVGNKCAPISVVRDGVSYTDVPAAYDQLHPEGAIHTSVITNSPVRPLHLELVVDDALSVVSIATGSPFSKAGIREGMRLITLMGERAYSRKQVEELLLDAPSLFMVVVELFCTAHTDISECIGECEWSVDHCIAIPITEADITEDGSEEHKPKVRLVLVITLVLTTFSILGMILFSVHRRTSENFQQLQLHPELWKANKKQPVMIDRTVDIESGKHQVDNSASRKVSFSKQDVQIVTS